MNRKYKVGDWVYSEQFEQYGNIWDIRIGQSDYTNPKEECYVVKWYGRGSIDQVAWGAFHSIEKTDKDSNIRLATNTERILYGK